MAGKRTIGFASLTLLLAFLFFSCSTDPADSDGNDGNDGEEVEFTEMLRALGVDYDNPARRLDGNGNNVDVEVNPFGYEKVVVRKDCEIFLAGLQQSSDGDSAYFVVKNSSNYTKLSEKDSDSAWTKYYHKVTDADLDGDGYDEVVAVYYDDSDDGVVILRELSYNEGTYAKKAEYSFDAGDTDDFEFRQTIAAGDIDGDGNDEILVINSTLFLIYDDDYSLLYEEELTPLDDAENACIRVTCDDFDGDGLEEIVLVNGTEEDDKNARGYIYDWNGTGLTVVENFTLNNDSITLHTANVATGDFDGDNIPEIAFTGLEYDSGDNHYLFVMDVYMDTNSECVFEMLDTQRELTDDDSEWLVPLACGDLDGDAVAEIVAFDKVYILDEGELEDYDGDDDDDFTEPFIDMLSVGDVSGNGLADIVFVDDGRDHLYVYSVDSSGDIEGDDVFGLGHTTCDGGCICLPDIDRDSYILGYESHELKFTSPRIIAVITSPPYWTGKDQNLTSTILEFGKSDSTTTETTDSYGFSVSTSFGVSVEAPLWGSAFSSTSKVTIKNSFTWSFSESTTITVTRGYGCAAGEDKVVFSCIPFDIYYYTITSSPDESEIGETTVISIPRTPAILSQTREYYNANNGVNDDVTGDVVNNYVAGNPLSYPDSGDRDAIREENDGDGLYTYQEDHVMTVGQGSGYTTLSIEELTGESSSFDYNLSISQETEVVFGGVLVGRGMEFDYGYSYTNSVSSGTYVSATIGDLNRSDYSDYIYKYGIMAYPETLGDTQEFTLVTCWVDEID